MYTTNYTCNNINMSSSRLYSLGNKYLYWNADDLMKMASDSMKNEEDIISCNDYLSAIGCEQNNGRT